MSKTSTGLSGGLSLGLLRDLNTVAGCCNAAACSRTVLGKIHVLLSCPGKASRAARAAAPTAVVQCELSCAAADLVTTGEVKDWP